MKFNHAAKTEESNPCRDLDPEVVFPSSLRGFLSHACALAEEAIDSC